MFKTYREKLQEIEKSYEKKDYEHVVVESAKVTEQAVGHLFRSFHMSLSNLEERLNFLEFEKAQGEKYSAFLKNPTIGVGIGFYNSLLSHCADHDWLKSGLKSSLNTINTHRNAQVHAGKAVITDHEAGEVLDATEIFLKGIDLLDFPIEDVGFPLKYFLVYTSVKSKFEKGETETDFQRIISDSSKLIPDLLNSVFNKVYPFLPIEDKDKLNRLHPKTLTSDNKESSLVSFVQIFEEINLFDQIEEGESLKHSLQAIAEKYHEVYSRRAARHHVNILEIIFKFIHNKKLDHYLDYADLLKKKYLEDNQINDTDRIILNDRAKELKISENLAVTIESTVVRTIEKELILFQTLHEEKESEKEISREEQREPAQKSVAGLNRRTIFFIGGILVLAAILIIYLFLPKSELSRYERAHLEIKHDEVVKIIGSKRPLSNIKANYHFIYSSSILNSFQRSDELISYYQDLFRENPNSPEAHLYLGFVYSWSTIRWERDSSWIMVNKALDMGLDSEYANIIKAHILERHGLPSSAQQYAIELVARYPDNPRVLELAGESFLQTVYDTTKAIEMYEAVRMIYPDYVWYYSRMGLIAMNRGDLVQAEEMLNKGMDINHSNPDLTATQVEILLKQSRTGEAEKILIQAIEGFGKDQLFLYYLLITLYENQDRIEEALKITEAALKEFPGHWFPLNMQDQLKTTQRWIKENSGNETKAVINWQDDFNKALALAQKEKKPLFAVFVTSSGESFITQRIIRYTEADQSLVNLMSEYIPVQIKYGTYPELFDQYQLEYPFWDLLMIADDGKKIEDITDRFYRHDELIVSLEENIVKYENYNIGKSLNSEDYTEANNFENAMIMANVKDYIILAVVSSQGNRFSQKLMDETLNDPVFQAEFNNLVFLKLEQNQSRDFINSWNIKIFPSILFFDKKGSPIYKAYGYKPPGLLARITREIKEAHYNNVTYEPELNWLYSIEEAKTIATVEQKNIFVSTANALNRNTLIDERVKKVLNEQYIIVDIDEMSYGERVQNLGFNLYYSGTAILEPSGNILFHSNGHSDPDELLSWLDTEEKMKMLAVLGIEGYSKYQDEVLLATQFNRDEMYGSAISVFVSAIITYSENYENYLEVATIYLNWFKPDKALEYFLKAIEKGAPIERNLTASIISAYLQMEEEESAINWLERTLADYQNDLRSLGNLYLGFIELYDILQMNEEALEYAELASRLLPNVHEIQYEYGRILYKNNEFSRALEQLKMARNLDRSDAATNAYLGLCYESMGDEDRRDAAFGRARILNFDFQSHLKSWDYWFRPNFYKYPGYIEIIGQDFLTALKVDSTNALMSNNLAYFYSVEGINLDEAMVLANRSLDEDPDNYATLDTKAWILYMQGNYAEADTYLQRAIELTPEDENDQITLYHLGKIKLALGEKDGALQYLKEAYTLPEPDAEGMRLCEDIEKILEE